MLFYYGEDESDVFILPDDIPEDELKNILEDMFWDWAAYNIESGYWEEVDE